MSAREIVLSLTGHFKLFTEHLIEFNYAGESGEFRVFWMQHVHYIPAKFGDEVAKKKKKRKEREKERKMKRKKKVINVVLYAW